MGTRADFCIGQGDSAEWLGSVGWDGYEWDDADGLFFKVATPDEMRAVVKQIADERRDFTSPARGWPWPWEDSNTTDYAYAFLDGVVKASRFGCPWYALGSQNTEEAEEPQGDPPNFPNMSARQNVAFDDRSGAIFVAAR